MVSLRIKELSNDFLTNGLSRAAEIANHAVIANKRYENASSRNPTMNSKSIVDLLFHNELGLLLESNGANFVP